MDKGQTRPVKENLIDISVIAAATSESPVAVGNDDSRQPSKIQKSIFSVVRPEVRRAPEGSRTDVLSEF